MTTSYCGNALISGREFGSVESGFCSDLAKHNCSGNLLFANLSSGYCSGGKCFGTSGACGTTGNVWCCIRSRLLLVGVIVLTVWDGEPHLKQVGVIKPGDIVTSPQLAIMSGYAELRGVDFQAAGSVR